MELRSNERWSTNFEMLQLTRYNCLEHLEKPEGNRRARHSTPSPSQVSFTEHTALASAALAAGKPVDLSAGMGKHVMYKD